MPTSLDACAQTSPPEALDEQLSWALRHLKDVDPSTCDNAQTYVYLHWQDTVQVRVIRACPTLPKDRVATAVNDTFLDFYHAVGNSDSLHRHPARLLLWIAKRRAADQFRTYVADLGLFAVPGDDADFLRNVMDTGPSPAENAVTVDFLERFGTACRKLPGRQREVAVLFPRCVGSVTPDTIVMLYQLEHGITLPRPAAKRALEEIRKKFRRVLQ